MDSTLLGAWWQVLAVVLAAIIAAIIAIWGIQSQRAISRKTLTFTHLGETDSDKDVIEARKIFITEASNPSGLTPWAAPGQEHTRECEAIRLVLNEFELMSVGIQLGIVDYEFYKRYHRGTVIKYWYAAPPSSILFGNRHSQRCYITNSKSSIAASNRGAPRSGDFVSEAALRE